MPVTAGRNVWTDWTWEPSVLVGLALFSLAYAAAVGPLRRKFRWGQAVSPARQLLFYLGVISVFLALCSPLDELGDEYLFSAHMAQHMLLTFVAPPLWLLGTPEWLLARLFPTGPLRRLYLLAASPLAAFVIFNGVMWVWHIPRFYDATLESEGLHIFEHLTFIASAVVGWSPVLVAAPLNRLPDPLRALYLFLSSFPCTALAAVLTFSPRVLYPFYAAAPRLFVNLPAMTDQWVGGLIMWLVGDMILVSASLVIVYRWLGSRETPAEILHPEE